MEGYADAIVQLAVTWDQHELLWTVLDLLCKQAADAPMASECFVLAMGSAYDDCQPNLAKMAEWVTPIL